MAAWLPGAPPVPLFARPSRSGVVPAVAILQLRWRKAGVLKDGIYMKRTDLFVSYLCLPDFLNEKSHHRWVASSCSAPWFLKKSCWVLKICPHISQSNSKFCQGVRKEADPAGNIWSNSWMNTFESWRPRKAWKRTCANKKRYRRRGSNTWITEGLWVDTVGTDGKAARDNLILHTHEVLGASVCSIMFYKSIDVNWERGFCIVPSKNLRAVKPACDLSGKLPRKIRQSSRQRQGQILLIDIIQMPWF